MNQKRIIFSIGSASGSIYARWILRLLAQSPCYVDLIISRSAEFILKSELSIDSLDPSSIAGRAIENVTVYEPEDLAAPIASGSVPSDGMIICPCSSNTLSAIAQGQGSTLVHRAAYVTLKQRRRLVLVHREAPLTSIDIDNMARVTAAGAIVFPASPVFYTKPQSIDDLAAAIAHRVLELADIQLNNPFKWQGRS